MNNIKGERESKEGLTKKTLVMSSTLRALHRIRKKLEETVASKSELGQDGDSYHDEVFKTTEQSIRTQAARALGLLPSLLSPDGFESEVGLIEPRNDLVIGLGSEVVVRIENDEPEIFILVSPLDVTVNPDEDNRWISTQGPVGGSLIGRAKGDRVFATSPSGQIGIEICEVRPFVEEKSDTD